jgi:hypothetical protein
MKERNNERKKEENMNFYLNQFRAKIENGLLDAQCKSEAPILDGSTTESVGFASTDQIIYPDLTDLKSETTGSKTPPAKPKRKNGVAEKNSLMDTIQI